MSNKNGFEDKVRSYGEFDRRCSRTNLSGCIKSRTRVNITTT